MASKNEEIVGSQAKAIASLNKVISEATRVILEAKTYNEGEGLQATYFKALQVIAEKALSGGTEGQQGLLEIHLATVTTAGMIGEEKDQKTLEDLNASLNTLESSFTKGLSPCLSAMMAVNEDAMSSIREVMSNLLEKGTPVGDLMNKASGSKGPDPDDPGYGSGNENKGGMQGPG